MGSGTAKTPQGTSENPLKQVATEEQTYPRSQAEPAVHPQPFFQTTETVPEVTTETNSFEMLTVGQTVLFGSYEQDDIIQNGKEPIEWVVLSTDGESALLLSKCGLERRTYTNYERNATWADSDLLNWLNGSFLKNSFTADEQARLLQKYNTTAKNPQYPDLEAGQPTTDSVFCLSFEEAESLLPTAELRRCVPTQHLVNQGALVNEGCCWWWLRNPGEGQIFVMGVTTKGVIHYAGNEDYLPGSVRPAIVVRIT